MLDFPRPWTSPVDFLMEKDGCRPLGPAVYGHCLVGSRDLLTVRCEQLFPLLGLGSTFEDLKGGSACESPPPWQTETFSLSVLRAQFGCRSNPLGWDFGRQLFSALP